MINLRLKLNDNAKGWFCDALGEMIAIDGKIEKEELQFAEIAVQFCQSQKEKDILLSKIKTNEFGPLTDLRDISRGHAIEILIFLAKTACADGVLTKSEIRHLHKCTLRLGFNEDIFEELITYARMRIPFKHDEDELRQKAIHTEAHYIRTMTPEK